MGGLHSPFEARRLRGSHLRVTEMQFIFSGIQTI